MKQYLALLVSLSILGMTGVAFGSVINQGAIEDESQDLKIPLSSNKLDTELSVEQTQRERAERPTSALEFGVSSWEPSNLQPPSRISSGLSSFGLSGPPALSLNTISPAWGDVSLVGGVQFLMLSRTGSLSSAGISSSETQTAYIPQLRLGAQYAPMKLSTKLLRPYFSAAVLPTSIITGRTSFDDGEADFGVAGEAGLGTLIHVSSLFDLNINVTGTVGSVASSSLNGLGVGAGVRVGL